MVSPSSSFDPPQSYGNFKLSAGPISLSKTYNIPVGIAKWTSDKTGLRVVLVDVEGPLVNLFASVSTEIFNDSGCPHTLEHLVFLGSEKYPYKGVLDTLANRAFARGTNAWTDTTNTTYTITTAGEEGFLRILPVYMDHLLYPTLTDAGFTTEVYHLNGKGEDAGVVYSEMQGRENQSWSLMELAYQRALYSEGSAYRSETGGLMDKLRVLTIDQIRDYHASYYLPHNTCLFVTGKIDPTKLLKVLTEEVEPSIEKHQQAKGPKPQGWKRPFVETPSAEAPKLKKARVEIVDFPEKDESMGEVNINWVGVPQKDHMTDSAINNLNTYLSDSAISPLQKALIEIEEPFATDVSFNAYDQLTTVVQLSFSSVPTERLQTVGEEARKVMQQIADEGVDMERMSMLLDREQRKLLNLLEKDAAEPLTHSLLSDFLFGAEDGSEMAKVVDDITRVRELKNWSQQQWTDLLRRFYLDQPSLTIIGKPSAKLASQLEKAVADRLRDNIDRLGEDGLKKLQEKVDQAVEANDTPIPSEMISSFKIPDVNGIRWIPVTSAGSGKNPLNFDNDVQKCLDAGRVDLPYSIQFEHIQSNFVEVSVYMDAGNLAARKELLALYIGSFHSLPVTRADGTKLTYEEVVKLLDAETVDYDISLGAGLSEQLAISVKVEKEKYPIAIRWLNDLLFGAEFDVSRLRIVANKILQNLPSEKREGSAVAAGALREMTQDKNKSSSTALSLLSKIDTAADVMERLKSQPDEVVADLKQLRTALSTTKGMRVSVAGDILTLEQPLSSWKTEFKVSTSDALRPVTLGRDCMSPLGKNPAKKAMLIPLPTIESSYSYHVAKGPNDYLHPDLPAIMVARTAVNALEGLLWRNIRGVGLAYGCNIINDVERGLIYFRVFKSPDCGKAYVAGREAMQGMIEGRIMPLNELRIETAKSELAVSTADSASTMSDAAETSFVNQALKGVPQSYQRDLLAKCGSVTVEQANEAVRKWIMPIFDSASSITVAVSSTSKADDVEKQLTELGFEVETRTIHSGADNDESGSDSEGGEGDQSTESWSEVEHSDTEQKSKL